MMKRTKYKFLLTLALTIGAGVGSSFAADAPIPAPAVKTEPNAPGTSVVVTGKIVVVDKAAGTLTVDVDGKIQTLKLGPNVKMVNNGKFVTLDQLATGQEVSVLTRRNPDGSFAVVALSVNPSSVGEIPAGKRAKPAKGKKLPATPFNTVANPANSSGPVVSPAR